jgi:branched-chain amino acid transport system permease protein
MVAARMEEPTPPRSVGTPRRSWPQSVVVALRSPRIYGPLLLAALYWMAKGWKSYDQFVVSSIAIYAIVGAGLVVLVGASGQLSLGHAAFLAVGAYAATNISVKTGWGLPGEIAVALVVSVFVGTVVGLPSLRLAGLYLAVGTLALGYAAQQLMYNWDAVTGGGFGQAVGPLRVFGRDVGLLAASFALLAITFVLASNLLRGRTGRALNAIRTSEPAARAVGIEVELRRVLAFTTSAALAAVGGVLYAHAVTRITPEAFSVELSIYLVIMVIIGGQRSLLGAILGAAFVVGLPEQFRSIADWDGIVYGVVLLALIIFSPDGLVGVGQRVWSIVRVRREPSPSADTVSDETTAGSRARDERRSAVGGRPVTVGLAAWSGAGASASALTLPGLPLSLTDVGVTYGGVNAVESVTFGVGGGEVVGLIGPNGAGKTTLFNAITGLVRATGEIRFGDVDVSGAPVHKRVSLGVGRTFQNLSLHDGMTPIEHVLVGAHRHVRYNPLAEMIRWPTVVRTERRAEQMALEVLDLLGLAEVATEPADVLPYGLQKRVDVARALASRPRLLMLDEPAAGLPHDEANTLIDRVLATTKATETSVVIIEHNVELVRRVCDRIVVLDAGRLIADDTPDEIMRNERVEAAYLGG